MYDHIDKDAIEIDTINFKGPFKEIDNRLMSLQLIKNGMTQAVICPIKKVITYSAAELYKKNILTIRGSFRPVTKVNIDMVKNL